MAEPTEGSPVAKSCAMCGEAKGYEEFHKDRRRRDGHFPYCKACRMMYDGRTPRAPRMFATKAEYDRAHRETMPAKEKTLRHREGFLWTTYRMTVAEYDAMAAQQNHACAICGQPESATSQHGTPKHLTVDHDHRCCPGRRSCGRCVRALLCNRCNQGLGHLGDDERVMQSAIDYLHRFA